MKVNIKLIYALFILYFLYSLGCIPDNEALKYQIKKGKFLATLIETGDLDAVKSRVIKIPYIGWKYGWRIKIIGLLEHGASISKGDSIAQLDQAGVLKILGEKQNELEVEQAALNKLLVEHKSKLRAIETELATAEASLNLQKVELEKYSFESEQKRAIKKLELEKTEIQYKKTQKKYLLTKKILKNELKIQKLKIFQLENEIKDANHALSQLRIVSPLSGMMQRLKNRRTRQIVKVGDELHHGQKFACVPDLSEMKVNTTVNETDISKIHLNQSVIVRLDAFPDKPFDGKIIEIGKLSYKKDEKSRTKVFDIVILLDKSDPILKPGMTVSCEIITSELDNVFYVENDCILKQDQQYYIFMNRNGKNAKCNVQIGPRNNQFTVIYGDFKAGQRILPLNQIKNNQIAKVGI